MNLALSRNLWVSMDTSLIVNGETRFTNLQKTVRMSRPSTHDDDDDDHDSNDDDEHTRRWTDANA